MSPEAGTLEPTDLSAVCPECGGDLWAERRGQWTLKAAILKLAGGRFIAKCAVQKCDGEVLVPWLKAEGLKPPQGPRRVGIRLDRAPSSG